MNYDELYDEREVVESAIAEIAEIANLSDEGVLADIRKIVAFASVRIAEIELEYNEDSAPFSVADMLDEV